MVPAVLIQAGVIYFSTRAARVCHPPIRALCPVLVKRLLRTRDDNKRPRVDGRRTGKNVVTCLYIYASADVSGTSVHAVDRPQ